MQAPDWRTWSDREGKVWYAFGATMKDQSRTIGPWLQRFAWMVALVVVLRVVAWDLHQVVDHHELDQPCEICLVTDRAGDGMLPIAGHLAQATAEALSAPPPADFHALTFTPCPLPRGPPSSLS